MSKSILCLAFFFLSHLLPGQYHQFSQLNYAQQRVNPASIALDDYARATLMYRTQRSVPEVQLSNYLLSAI